MSVNVGEVISVRGTQVTLRIFDESSLETLFHNGDKYKGVCIREYIGIKRGFCLIICVIEGEYLDENRFESEENKRKYIRKVEVKPIGYFEQGKFNDGIKLMPMIKDTALLLSENQIVQVFGQCNSGDFTIGKLLNKEIELPLPWQKIFNSHIGIFGNTGSGKSNTLTKLYSELFHKYEDNLIGKSIFLLIDFNGEYTGNQLIKNIENKKSYILSTSKKDGSKFPLHSSELWNAEILALLFKATPNTQAPFINRVVNGRRKYTSNDNSLKKYIGKTFESCFVSTSQKAECLVQLKEIAKLLKYEALIDKLNDISWHSSQGKFKNPSVYFDDESTFTSQFRVILDNINVGNIDSLDELILRCHAQMVNDLTRGYIQHDHIQPLLKRIDAITDDLRKVFDVSDDAHDKFNLLNIVSLRGCNQAIKKIVPLLLAKMFYHNHKETVKMPTDKTLHFIIDEAHNILSQQSSREHEVWKDHRLELFEEIIKEGRKFGMYLTLSSQRPADISPTIMSQIHNFFIHRLVNDKDLFLIDNTISTLDRMSKSLIPNLSKGCCVITGTAFDLPVVLQVDYIKEKENRPDSDDIDLELLWGIKNE